MIITPRLLQKVIKPRPNDSHKGTFGHVLLIGGLYPYGGAIIMAALACVNGGAGLVTVATDCKNIGALHSHLPEAMAFDIDDREYLEEQLKKASVVLIGPGLGESQKAVSVFRYVLKHVNKEQFFIIDGSGLSILSHEKRLEIKARQLILTPHQKEWERLSHLAITQQNQENNSKALEYFPAKTILVAKSSHTSIYQGQKKAELRVGGPYQATGGMGDTLAGLIASFVAQFKGDSFEVVASATFLHSFIAERLAKHSYVVLPTAISREIPQVMKEMMSKETSQ